MLFPRRSPLLKPNFFTSKALMRSKPLVKPAPFAVLPTIPSCTLHFNTPRLIFSTSPFKLVSKFRPIFLKTCCFSYVSHTSLPTPVLSESPVESSSDSAPLKALTKRLKDLGFESDIRRTGQHNDFLCPRCKGGDTKEKSLSLNITTDGNTALWNCFRSKCGWKDTMKAFADDRSTYETMNQTPMIKQIREMTEESLGLELPCREILKYFDERMLSVETLQRNSVRQRRYGDQIFIAFAYRRNGVIVGCKYRCINKKFRKEKGSENIFYGLDDIKDASDIIIVEGEMDKLAMEEAGFRNCISVPDGAPQKVSNKELPPEDKDKPFQYLWNCKDYVEKASRIILATDGDQPGQALAEELARRLGKERCWRVRWPKKNDIDHFKDANEVLMSMGPGVLREVFEGAELYPIITRT